MGFDAPVLATCEDPPELSGFRGVARIEAVLYDPDGLWVILVDVPYDGTVLLARCPTRREADVLVMAINLPPRG